MKNNQSGSSVVVVVMLVAMTLLFIVAAGLAGWAYSQRSDYKNNSDQKAQAAVAAATAAQKVKLDKDYAEQAKSPVKTYVSPEEYGTVTFSYPKTWSAYIDDSGTNSGIPVNGYLYPNVVPELLHTSFALRVQVIPNSYDQEIKQYDNLIKSGKSRAMAYKPAKLASNAKLLPGTRIEGQIESDKQGILIIVPVRDKTLKVWTEAKDFYNDFNNIVLPSLTYTP